MMNSTVRMNRSSRVPTADDRGLNTTTTDDVQSAVEYPHHFVEEALDGIANYDPSPPIDEETIVEELLELPPALLVPFAVVLATLLIFGVVGNILVISVLIRARLRERSRGVMATATTTNAYILSLSAADLLFLVFCAPFQGTVYILNHWPYGWVMCKVAHYCQYSTVYASIWILTMMSVDRYVAIGHPLKSVKWRHPRQAIRISAVVWLTAALLSFPWLILYEAEEHESGGGDVRIACYDAWSDATYDYRKWMILFVFLIGFLVPSCVIFCMAVLVAKSIRTATHQPMMIALNSSIVSSSSQPPPQPPVLAHPGGGGNGYRQRTKFSIGGGEWSGTAVGVRLQRRRRVGWLVFALAFLFFFCWMPHNLSVIWLNFDSTAVEWITSNQQAFFVIKLLAHMMTYVNSCINPILYSLASNNFRGRFMAFMPCGGDGNGRRRSTSAYNSSCRVDNRTYQLHAGATAVWFRRPSAAGVASAAAPTPPVSVRKGSTMSTVNGTAGRKGSGSVPQASRPNGISPAMIRTPEQLASNSPRSIARRCGRGALPSFPMSLDSEAPLLPPSARSSVASTVAMFGGAVHLISKRLEEARRAQKRHCSGGNGSGSGGVNGNVRRRSSLDQTRRMSSSDFSSTSSSASELIEVDECKMTKEARKIRARRRSH